MKTKFKLGIKLLSCCLFLIMAVSCNKNNPENNLNQTNQKLLQNKNPLIAKILPSKETVWLIPESKIKVLMQDWFKDQTIINTISIIEELNDANEQTFHILGEGFEGGNSRQILLYLDIEVSVNNPEILLLRFNGGVDSCTGDPCSYCVFTKGKGCACKGTGGPSSPGGGFCNHSTGEISVSLLVN